MKRCVTLTMFIYLLITLNACAFRAVAPSVTGTPSAAINQSAAAQTESEPGDIDNGMTDIHITIGDVTFTAKLYENETAAAFLARLPLTLNMSELNGSEKYCYLTDSLPTDSKCADIISAGDLMLYGSDCLVLFYESFSTSYSYTRIGYIEDASGLAAALGSGNAEVLFSVSD